MKLLHENKAAFDEIIKSASHITGIKLPYIEKDYYVFMTLKLMNVYNENLMFKGGTSLSKAWHILERFSEDIDVNLLPEINSTDSTRQKMANSVINALNTMGLPFNRDDIHRRQEYNTYLGNYDSLYSGISTSLLKELKIETMANKKGKILNATYTPCWISNYIWDALNNKYGPRFIEFGIDPFVMNTQNMDVTFVEKCMSLANHYIKGDSVRVSRHLYDIFIMGIRGNLLSFNLRYTIDETKRYLMERTNDLCLRQSVPASEILKQALYNDFYRLDFETSTNGLKYNINDGITYDICKEYLLRLINEIGVF